MEAPTIAPHRPRLVDVPEIARQLGVCARTVWRLRDAGKMPPEVRVVGRVKWSSEDIDQWIRDGCPPQKT
jgi:predicted DNA-binding transcriptional regulator AlpA